MKILSPTSHHRLNEAVGLLMLAAGVCLALSLESYNPLDPSWNTAAPARPQNLLGYPGAYAADLALQLLGFGAFLLPVFLLLLSWKWIRSEEVVFVKPLGATLLLLSLCGALALPHTGYLWKQTVEPGGLAGRLVADSLAGMLNTTGEIGRAHV